MRKVITVIILLFILGGCAIGPTSGVLFTYNDFAGEFNPMNDVSSQKTAEGCQHMILGLFAFGDAGAGQVALENGISRISTIDHSTLSILTGLYSSYCTIVTGE